MKLKNTKTEKNLLEAFAGESMARNKYTYFASKAKKEGYVQMSDIFTETANNEKEHAKLWFKYLNDGISSTKDNLKAAAEGEHSEWTDMYKRMAQEAIEEGFEEIAQKFLGVAKIEEEHEKRYKKLLENLENDKVFSKNEQIEWKCVNCGLKTTSKNAPDVCPVCNHPKSYFEENKINY